MKLIQNRELSRIIVMVKSGDQEMRNLAAEILRKKQLIRLNWMTIIAIHMLLFLGSLTLMIYLSYTYKLGLYLIPLITTSIFQGFWSVFHLMVIWKARVDYNKHMQQTIKD